jgi:tripartite ATP-independent transporter DctP family solute receptor
VGAFVSEKKTMKLHHTLFLALSLTCATPLALAQTDISPLILKFNHTDTPSGTRQRAAEVFAKKVQELSNGRMRVLVFHSGQLGNDPQSIKLLAEGKLDFTVSATGSFAQMVPALNLTALPYLVKSYEEGWRFYDDSAWIKSQFDKLPEKGLRRLATWESGFRNFTTKTALNTPADAKGKKMRVFPNEMIKWVMQSIGYEPVVYPVTEVYAAIQQGKVDGQENPIDTIRSLRFYEVAPHVVLTQHVYSPLPMVVSEATWAKLSASDREAIRKAAIEAQTVSRTLVRKSDEQNLQAMVAAGAIVTRPDLAAFKRATEGVYAQAKVVYGAEVDAIKAAAATAAGQ